MAKFSITRTAVIAENPDGATVDLTIADNDDLSLASESVIMRVRAVYRSNPLFAEIQAKALLRARDLIALQIQAKTAVANQSDD